MGATVSHFARLPGHGTAARRLHSRRIPHHRPLGERRGLSRLPQKPRPGVRNAGSCLRRAHWPRNPHRRVQRLTGYGQRLRKLNRRLERVPGSGDKSLAIRRKQGGRPTTSSTSPSIRHYFLSMSVQPCYNPIETQSMPPSRFLAGIEEPGEVSTIFRSPPHGNRR